MPASVESGGEICDPMDFHQLPANEMEPDCRTTDRPSQIPLCFQRLARMGPRAVTQLFRVAGAGTEHRPMRTVSHGDGRHA